ncbi:putative metallopeptidase (Zinc) SprT family [Streptococcus sp. DD12]|nr:putative metallopeptidase (Zinc) SprT family [Streptococcus sp. DD12]
MQLVSLEDFQLPFRHQVQWNNRLRTTGGRFFPKDGHLDFNPKVLEELGQEIFRKIVRHELCHYHLYYAKKGYRHQDADFKRLLAQVDGLRYMPPLPSQQKTYKYRYICSHCGQEYLRQRRMNLQRYRCGHCRGRLIIDS